MLQGVIALLRGGEREVTGRTLPTMSLCEYIKVHFHALLRQSVGEVLGQFNPQHLFEFTFFIIVLSGIFPTQSMVFWICFLVFFSFFILFWPFCQAQFTYTQKNSYRHRQIVSITLCR